MELVKIINGNPVPYTEAAFRAANKHTVYGPVVSSRHLNPQGVYRVSKPPKPEVPVGQKAEQDVLPTQNEAGHWVLGWTLVPLSEDEARELRDQLLSESDWVVAKASEAGQPVAPQWVEYRQALRDITAQAGFPYEVTWPIKP